MCLFSEYVHACEDGDKRLIAEIPIYGQQNLRDWMTIYHPTLRLDVRVKGEQLQYQYQQNIFAGTPHLVKVDELNTNGYVCVYAQFESQINIELEKKNLTINYFREQDIFSRAIDFIQLYYSKQIVNFDTYKTQLVDLLIGIKSNDAFDLNSYEAYGIVWQIALTILYENSEFDLVEQLFELIQIEQLDTTQKLWANQIRAEANLMIGNLNLAHEALDILDQTYSSNELNLKQIWFEYLTTRAAVYMASNDHESAYNFIQSARQLIADSKNELRQHAIADFFDLMGHFNLIKYYKFGEEQYLNDALEAEMKAVEVALLIDDDRQTSRIFSNIAWMYKTKGQLDHAIRNYLNSWHYAQSTEGYIISSYILSNLAALSYSTGEYQNALIFAKTGYLKSVNKVSKGDEKRSCFIGEILEKLNFYNEAEQYLLQCFSLDEQTNSTTNENKDHVVLGLISLFEIYQQQGNIKKQTLIVNKLRSLNQGIVKPYTKIAAAMFLAQRSFAQNDLSKAKEWLNMAQTLSHSSADANLKVTVLMQSAALLLQHDRSQALELADSAIGHFSRLSSQISQRRLTDKWKATLYEFITNLNAYFIDTQDWQGLFEFQTKIRNMGNIKQLNIDSVYSPTKQARLDEISQLSLLQTLPEQQDSDSKEAFFNNQFELIFKQYQLNWFNADTISVGQAELDFYALNNNVQLNHLNLTTIGLEDYQKQLFSNQATLIIVKGELNYWALYVDKNHLQATMLGEIETIKSLVNEASLLSSTPNRSPNNALHQLSELLFSKLTIGGDITYLNIVPTEGFYKLPFVALHLGENNQYRPFSDLTLIQSNRIQVNSRLVKNIDIEESEIAVFADPRIKIENSDKQSWITLMPPLPWSEQEAFNISAIFPSSVSYMQTQASRENLFSSEVRNAAAIHISTHSYFDQNNPDIVGLSFSNVNSQNEQIPAFVTQADIRAHNFDNQLVFLNGCDSALGEDNTIVGYQSMSSAFLDSGAQQVIGTLWPISDKASALFVDYFYQSLSITKQPAVALQEAVQQMKRNPRYRHPFYWAAYVLTH